MFVQTFKMLNILNIFLILKCWFIEYKGQPLKQFWADISRTFNILNICWTKYFKFFKTFHLITRRKRWPLKVNRALIFFFLVITFYWAINNYLLQKQKKCSSWGDLPVQYLTLPMYCVIRGPMDQVIYLKS